MPPWLADSSRFTSSRCSQTDRKDSFSRGMAYSLLLDYLPTYMSPDYLFWYLSVKNRYRQIFGFNRTILRVKWRTIHSSFGRRRLALRNTVQLAYGWHSSLPWPEGSLWSAFSPCVICYHLHTNLLRPTLAATALAEQSKRQVSFASVLAKPNAFYSALSEPDKRRECKAFIGGFHANRPGRCTQLWAYCIAEAKLSRLVIG